MKTITTKPTKVAYLRTAAGLPTEARVDRERHVIYGATLMQSGDLAEGDSRPWYVDETTLRQLVSLGKAQPKGVKARWTHPSMSSDGLGKFVGRWRKFRLSEDGQSVKADLHLAAVAFRGGETSKGQWIEDMAANEPDAFGVSIAPVNDDAAMDALKSDDGAMPIRLRRLMAADIVDEPAATRGGFFGGELSIATAPGYATEFLTRLFGDAPDEVVRERCIGFVDSFLASRGGGQLQPAIVGETEMANEITQDQLSAALSQLGESLLAKLDEKLAAIQPAKEEADDEAASNHFVVAERKRCSELQALAKNAGINDCDKIAQEWIDKGLSVVEAKAAVGDLAIAQNGLTKDAGEPADDPDLAYKSEYRAQLAAFTSMGLTIDEYIASRRIDDGK